MGDGALLPNLLIRGMSPKPSAQIASLYRYPVKGLSPEPLRQVALQPGQTFPADRRYAIENGPSGFDPAAPAWLSKTCFLMLMRHERLAELLTSYDDDSHVLTIHWQGRLAARGDLRTAEGRAAIAGFFTSNFSDELKGSPRVISGGGHSFSDVARKVVSILNLRSIEAVENLVGLPVDPLRFRANIYVTDWPAWHEFDLLGDTLAVGDVRLKVVKRITRCAAINVDPQSATRELDVLQQMMRRLGHADCGVYAEVIAGGNISVGDSITGEQPPLL
jgi:uncharacterized protein